MVSFLASNQKKWLYKPLHKHSPVVKEGRVFLVRASLRFAFRALSSSPLCACMQGGWLALVQAHQDRAFSGRAQDIDLEARLKREGGVGQGGEGARLDPGREPSHIGWPLVLATQHLERVAAAHQLDAVMGVHAWWPHGHTRGWNGRGGKLRAVGLQHA